MKDLKEAANKEICLALVGPVKSGASKTVLDSYDDGRRPYEHHQEVRPTVILTVFTSRVIAGFSGSMAELWQIL